MIIWLLAGGSVLFGFVVGRWWAPVVPLLLSVIVFSRDHAEYEGGDSLHFLVPIAGAVYALLVFVGVALRKLTSKTPGRIGYPPS